MSDNSKLLNDYLTKVRAAQGTPGDPVETGTVATDLGNARLASGAELCGVTADEYANAIAVIREAKSCDINMAINEVYEVIHPFVGGYATDGPSYIDPADCGYVGAHAVAEVLIAAALLGANDVGRRLLAANVRNHDHALELVEVLAHKAADLRRDLQWQLLHRPRRWMSDFDISLIEDSLGTLLRSLPPGAPHRDELLNIYRATQTELDEAKRQAQATKTYPPQ